MTGIVNGQTIPMSEGTATYVGQENGTDVSLFRFEDGNSYTLQAAQGAPLKLGYFNSAVKVQKNGLCTNCVDDSVGGASKRELALEKRTLLLGLLVFKGAILLSLFSWWESWVLGWKYHSGCLSGWESCKGYVWVGCGNDRYPRQQCGVTHGYLHHQSIPHLGWQSPWGGKYCGSFKGIPHFQWSDGSVCPHVIRRHRRRNNCEVPQIPGPPVCNRCSKKDDGFTYWGTYEGKFWVNKKWWLGKYSRY
jgi:hypothetical protein